MRRLLTFLPLLAVASAAPAPVVGSSADGPPALVVVVVVDQFRADYLARFRPHFSPGGFARLLNEGAHFADCRYRHGVTKTAAGHAVVLTGVHANQHGIIDNAWVDRGSLRRITCVEDASVELVGRRGPAGAVRPAGAAPRGSSPHQLAATTVGDELKLTGRRGTKVIGIASKDRSAILLGGKLADAAYWMDRGGFVTSTFYRPELPAWAKAFNEANPVEGYFGRTWERLLPADVYDAVQGPDDAEGESVEHGMARTFPKTLNGGGTAVNPSFYEAFENSPYKNEVLIAFAKAAVEHEQLGQRGVTDVLCLGFSTNDTVGHNYGPDSHEVMDITLRTDRLLAEFLDFLDAKVGLKNCTIVLTADHGISPLPERVKALSPQVSAGRIDNARLLQTCEAALTKAYGALPEGRRWLLVHESSVLFQRDVLRDKNITPAEAERVVRDALLTLEWVAVAYTRSELAAGTVSGAFAEETLRSFHVERSADVYYHMKPFWVDRKSGTNHGTPYTYDVHVPLLWFGRGVTPGTYLQPVGVDDIAPTLARILGILAPPLSRGQVLF